MKKLIRITSDVMNCEKCDTSGIYCGLQQGEQWFWCFECDYWWTGEVEMIEGEG